MCNNDDNFSLPAYLGAQINKRINDLEENNIDPETDYNLPIMKDLYKQMLAYKINAESSYNERIRQLYRWSIDRGYNHIAQVDRTVALILQPYRDHLHFYEIYILYVAIIYHDTRLFTGIDEDRQEAKREILALLGQTPHRAFEKLIIKIAASLFDVDRLENLSPAYPLQYNGITRRVDARALASILRFAEEISINADGIGDVSLSEIPSEHRLFWEYANCITCCEPKPAERKVTLEYSIVNTACFERFAFPRENKPKAKIQLFDYIIDRIETLDAERSICCANFRHFATIDTIDITLMFISEIDDDIGINPIKIELNEKYTQKSSFADAFYKKHPYLHKHSRNRFQKRLLK